jgi:hypothetical protein
MPRTRTAESLAAMAAALALATAGCASRGEGSQSPESPRGVVSLGAWAPAVEGRAFAEGGSAEARGNPRTGASVVAAGVLFRKWALTWDSATIFLPTSDLSGGSADSGNATRYSRACLSGGPKVLEVPGEAGAPPRFRLDALAGLRLHGVVVDDVEFSGTEIDFRERWVDPVAGLRAEGCLTRGVGLRFQGDAALGARGSDRAWRAAAALVLGPDPGFGIALGWEAQAFDFDRGRGSDLLRLDLRFGGPFLALEIRF